MKKFLSLLLILCMVLSLAACGGASEDDNAGTGLPGEGIKIALVTEKVGTQVFLLEMVNALNDAAAEYGFEATVAECADSAAFEENIRALVAEEYDLIIGGGWQSGDAINKVATEFPDAAAYALIDSEVEAESVKCISYYEQEGAYLIGMIAGLVTDGESHVYGSIHVNEGVGSWKWRYGYMEGVKAIDPEATFIFNYTASYSDPAKAKELAIQHFEQGAVFVNSAAAGGDSGTFEAAKEKGFFTSGQDVDLTTPDNPQIVSSQIKDTYASVKNLIDEFFGDNYDSSNSTWGTAEGTIGAVHVTHESPNPIHERLSEDDIALLKQAAEDIKSGKLNLIDMPTEEEYNAM
ncbi:MAG: BMP family ABC transporter substrate-binding protein [Firmicutes bacterium]|nr:BMP family ABC transporter substrate-binding protein [Bacillota bacterium]